MAKTPGKYEIPFDSQGNQLQYDTGYHVTWQPNNQFQDFLTYENFHRSGHSSYFTFIRASGKKVVVFMTELDAMIPFMINGSITGTFQFVKRGTSYGCMLSPT